MTKSCVNLTKKQFHSLCESEFGGFLEENYNSAASLVVFKLDKPELTLKSVVDIQLVDEWKQLVENYEVVRHYLIDSGYNPFISGHFGSHTQTLEFGSTDLASGLYLQPRLTPERKAFYESKAHNLLGEWVVKMGAEVKVAIRERFPDMPKLEEILNTLAFGFKSRY